MKKELPPFKDHEIHKQKFGSSLFRRWYGMGFDNAMDVAREHILDIEATRKRKAR